MKKAMAVVLTAAMTLTMGMTAMAAPSPSITTKTVQQVVVSSTIGANTQATVTSGAQTSVLPGTTFKTASGQTVDAASVAVVSAPATAAQAQAAAASLQAAITSNAAKIVNFTGVSGLALTDAAGNLNVVNSLNVALQTATGETVSQNGSISTAFVLSDILGGKALNAGETVQALYQRADGTWVAVPVVIVGNAIAIALPAFDNAVNVTFVVAQGTPMASIPAAAASSPRT